MKFDRDLEIAESLDRFSHLDLLLIQFQSMLLLGCRRDLLGGNRAEYLAVLARLDLYNDLAPGEILQYIGENIKIRPEEADAIRSL